MAVDNIMGFRIPNLIENEPDNPYNVPNYSVIEFVSPAEKIILSSIYGLGIQAAIAKQSLATSIPKETDFKQIDKDNIIYYGPDAKPDGKGGYKAGGEGAVWDGRMSPALKGMPVMCWLKIKGGSYMDLEGVETVYPDIIFDNILITLTDSRDIGKTPTFGGKRKGTIKEYISRGDWAIELRVLTSTELPVNDQVTHRNQNGVYPRENMEQFFQILDAPVSLEVDCWYLQQAGIRWIAIEPGTIIQQVEGEYEVQRLIIPACSDEPLIIKVRNQ